LTPTGNGFYHETHEAEKIRKTSPLITLMIANKGSSGNLLGNISPKGLTVNSQGRQPLEGDA
jgi:hypothetical protein